MQFQDSLFLKGFSKVFVLVFVFLRYSVDDERRRIKEHTFSNDIITLRLKQWLSSCQEELESFTSLKQGKDRVWDAGIKRIEGRIELTQDRIHDTEFSVGDVKGQKVKQMIKRQAKSLFEENRVKRRKISSQGRPSLLDSEDEEFVAKCIEDKATYHGR